MDVLHLRGVTIDQARLVGVGDRLADAIGGEADREIRRVLGECLARHADADIDVTLHLVDEPLPLGVKQSVMRDVLALQPVSKVVARLLTLVVENDDIDEIDEIVEAFEQRVMDLHHVVRAEITSAVPLSPEKIQAIEASLATASGARVVITPRVDPALLGGVVAKVGSRVYDGSVVRHLARIRARLVSGDSLQ